MDHIKRYNANPDVKMIVVLGEVGGVEEYDIVSAIKSGEIRKSVRRGFLIYISNIFLLKTMERTALNFLFRLDPSLTRMC